MSSELREAVESIRPKIRHLRWPSGVCSEYCGGCGIKAEVDDILDILAGKSDEEDQQELGLRLGLIEAIKVVLPTISHTRWPSGICSDSCQGCEKHRSVMVMLWTLKRDIKDLKTKTFQNLDKAEEVVRGVKRKRKKKVEDVQETSRNPNYNGGRGLSPR